VTNIKKRFTMYITKDYCLNFFFKSNNTKGETEPATHSRGRTVRGHFFQELVDQDHCKMPFYTDLVGPW
jgi:hypothetical protein